MRHLPLLTPLLPLLALGQPADALLSPGEGRWQEGWQPRLALTVEVGAHNVPSAPLDPLPRELPLYLGVSASWWALPYGALQVGVGSLRPMGETQLLVGARFHLPLGGLFSLLPNALHLGGTLQGGVFVGSTGMARRLFSPGASLEWQAHDALWLGAHWAQDLVDGLPDRMRLSLGATFLN